MNKFLVANQAGRSKHPRPDPVQHVNDLAHSAIVFFVPLFAGGLIGALIAWLSIRRMRAGFEWGLGWLLPLGLAILLVRSGLLTGDRRWGRSPPSLGCCSGTSSSEGSSTWRTGAPAMTEDMSPGSGSGLIT